MNIPYHRYLLWLMLEGKETQDILNHFDELSLPEPSEAVLVEYRTMAENLAVPPSVRRRILRRQPDDNDIKILEKYGLGELYRWKVGPAFLDDWRRGNWSQVERIIGNPILRLAIECALLTGVKSLEEFCQMLEVSTYKEQFGAPGIQFFIDHFFDHQKMSKVDWREYLKIAASDPYSYVRYHSALTQPRDDVMYLIGLPTKAAFSDFLKGILSTAEYKFRFYSTQGTEEGDKQAQKWAKMGIEAGTKYEKFSSSDVTDFAQTLQAEFEFIEPEIPQITGEMLSAVKPAEDQAKDQQSKIPAPAPLFQPETEV